MLKKLLRLTPLLAFLYFSCPLWMIGIATLFNLSGNQYMSIMGKILVFSGVPICILTLLYDKNRISIKKE